MSGSSDNPFHVTPDKFKKMIEFVKQVRDAQKKGDKNATENLEKVLDKTLKFYLDNFDKIDDVPF